MLALTITCEMPAAREPTTPASTSGPVTLGSKATAPKTTLVFASSLPAIEASTPRWRTSPTSPNESVGAKAVGGLGDVEQRADESQSRRDRISHAQLELLGLYWRQHLVAIDRRRRRNAGLLESRHPAAEHGCAVRETDDGRDIVERGLADCPRFVRRRWTARPCRSACGGRRSGAGRDRSTRVHSPRRR